MRAIEPVKFAFADGEERSLLLTHAGLKRAMQQHGLTDPGQATTFAVLSTIIYQSLPSADRETLSESDFEEILPFNVAVLRDLVGELTGTQDERPQVAQPTTPNPAIIG